MIFCNVFFISLVKSKGNRLTFQSVPKVQIWYRTSMEHSRRVEVYNKVRLK